MVENVYRNEATSPEWRVRAREDWPVLVLAAGGVLTLGWSGCLAWGAYSAVHWLIS